MLHEKFQRPSFIHSLFSAHFSCLFLLLEKLDQEHRIYCHLILKCSCGDPLGSSGERYLIHTHYNESGLVRVVIFYKVTSWINTKLIPILNLMISNSISTTTSYYLFLIHFTSHRDTVRVLSRRQHSNKI